MKKAMLLLGLVTFISSAGYSQFTASIVNVRCFDSCDGSANILPAGNYHYLWDNGVTTMGDSALCAGAHYCVVYDSVGQLLDTVHVSVTQPSLFSVSGIDTTIYIACNNTTNVTLYPTVSGGVVPYFYEWSNGVSTGYQSGNEAGVYYVTITDANGCQISGADTVLENMITIATSVVYLPSCNANIDISSTGATPPLTYSINGFTLPDSMVVNYPPGTYYVTVTDSNSCQTTNTVVVGPVIDSIEVIAPTCDHPNAGVIEIQAYAPGYIVYRWNNGDTTSLITNLTSGNYAITVTDTAGCQATHTYNLASNHDLNYYAYVVVSNANCDSASGSVSVSPYNGYPPYTYLWNTLPAQTTATAINLNAGTYSVTVTDSLGCVTQGSTNVGFYCNRILSGLAFLDSNQNCIFDSGELAISNLPVIATNASGTSFYGYSDNTGVYSITLPDTGTYFVSVGNYYGSCASVTACSHIQFVTFTNGVDSISNYNFSQVPGSGFDLAMHPGWNSANPGFEKDYWVYYYNQSTTSFADTATVSFQYDSNLVFLSSDVPYTTYTPAIHTLTWRVYPVTQVWVQIGAIRFTIPSSINLNYLLQSDFKIEPYTGDCDTSNNEMHFSDLVTGSHDPNEKTVEPAGSISTDDSVLTYTIHFQNTGTASTVFITVKDTLSPFLDPVTVLNLASSLKYSSFTISGAGILIWVFNPGSLPDSLTDASGSKGFITFSVKKKADVSVNSVISNSASVYFDYNSPIITNTVTDTVSVPLNISRVSNNNEVTVRAIPNPFKDATTLIVSGINQPFEFELFDLSGRLVKQMASSTNTEIQLPRNELSAGMYLYGILVNGKPAAYGKLVAE